MYVLEIPYFSLKKTFESGQDLRWIKVTDDKYIVINGGDVLKVEQSKDRIIFDCTEAEVLNKWWGYFDLAVDYDRIYYKIRAVDNDFKVIANRAKGVHVIKQNLFEAFVSAFFGDAERVLDYMNEIAKRTGVKHSQSMREMGMVVWYEFPAPITLIKKQNCLNGINLLGKKENILKLAELFVEGWFDEDILVGMGYDEIVEYLSSFGLFSQDEINLVCAKSFGFKNIFFNDVSIRQALEELGFDYDGFCEWYLDDDQSLRENANVLRYFLLYNCRNKIAKIMPEMLV